MDNTINSSGCEFVNETCDYKSEINKLRLENENYRQELYETRRKLEVSEALQRELEEAHQCLEQTLSGYSAKMDKKIQESEEKYRLEKKDYENRLASADTEILQKSKELDKLKKQVTEMESFKVQMDKIQDQSASLEDQNEPNKVEIEKLLTALQEVEVKNSELEDMVNDLNKQQLELKEALTITRNQLTEKNEQLESVHEELFSCRAELNALKATPASTSSRGNSLFAEVEDRYQMILSKMNAVQGKYQEVKQLCQAREYENKALKAERAVMLKRWEHDTVDTMEDSNNLISKYRSKINELQKKLLEKEKNNAEVIDADASSSYLQTLLIAKKKEVDKLQTQIENDAIKCLVQEDLKFQITKQLRYWRYKAMSMQAQIMALKSQLEGGLDTEARKMITEIIDNCSTTDSNTTVDFHDESTLVELYMTKNGEKLSFKDAMHKPKHSTLFMKNSSMLMFEELEAVKLDSHVSAANDTKIGKEANYEEKLFFKDAMHKPKHSTVLMEKPSILISEELEPLKLDSHLSTANNTKIGKEVESTQVSATVLKSETNKEFTDLNKIDKENLPRNSNVLTDFKRPNLSTLKNSIEYEKSSDKKLKKILRFTPDTKETQNSVLKKQPKQMNYPILSISDNEISNISLQ